jgi:hypothetical protein
VNGVALLLGEEVAPVGDQRSVRLFAPVALLLLLAGLLRRVFPPTRAAA